MHYPINLPAFSVIPQLCHECKLIFIQLDVTPEDTENIKPFNCGNDDLNGFLLEDARFYREKLIE